MGLFFGSLRVTLVEVDMKYMIIVYTMLNSSGEFPNPAFGIGGVLTVMLNVRAAYWNVKPKNTLCVKTMIISMYYSVTTENTYGLSHVFRL